jgi:hypothetical protein
VGGRSTLEVDCKGIDGANSFTAASSIFCEATGHLAGCHWMACFSSSSSGFNVMVAMARGSAWMDGGYKRMMHFREATVRIYLRGRQRLPNARPILSPCFLSH